MTALRVGRGRAKDPSSSRRNPVDNTIALGQRTDVFERTGVDRTAAERHFQQERLIVDAQAIGIVKQDGVRRLRAGREVIGLFVKGHRHRSRDWARQRRQQRGDFTKSALGRVSRTHRLSTVVRNCTRDEGGPFEAGSQVQVSSHRKLLSSRAMVVSVAETSGPDPGRRG